MSSSGFTSIQSEEVFPIKCRLCIPLALCLLLSVNSLTQDTEDVSVKKGVVPTIGQTIKILNRDLQQSETGNPNWFELQIAPPDVSNLGTNINYHDGAVIESTHNVYFIWYGNWSGLPATTILSRFIQDLNGSSYQSINNTYEYFAELSNLFWTGPARARRNDRHNGSITGHGGRGHQGLPLRYNPNEKRQAHLLHKSRWAFPF